MIGRSMSSSSSSGDNNIIFSYYSANDEHEGLTYAQWSAEWWRWAVSMPASENPLYRETIMDYSTTVRQPHLKDKHVYFLSGSLLAQPQYQQPVSNTTITNFSTRRCVVSSDTYFLTPIVSCEADFIELPEMKDDKDKLLDYVTKQAQTVDKKDCIINDKIVIPTQHVKSSSPQFFEIDVHPDCDRYGNGGGKSPAVTDGYWVFLKPFPKGTTNTIYRSGAFHDSNGNHLIGSSIYEITVV